MLHKYNGYTHQAGRVEYSRRETANENSARQVLSKTVRVELSGHLYATSSAGIEAEFSRLVAAYSFNQHDFLVYLPTGAVSNRLSLRTATAIGGVRVVDYPSLETLQNAAYTTYLPFKIALEAEYPATDAAILLREFEETIHTSGGGPVLAWYKPIVGRPTQGFVRQQDTYRATQTGRAVGYLARPTAPAPLWPSALNTSGDFTLRSPRRQGNTYVDFETTWNYSFESSLPLVAEPNAWL